MEIWVKLAVVGFFSIFGLITNVFILLTLWRGLGQVSTPPAEVIVSALAVANVTTILVSVFTMVVDFIHNYCEIQQKVAESFLALSHSLSFWVSALLCFFYCLKIVSVHRPIAKKLAQVISGNVFLWVGATALFSCALGALDCYIDNAAFTCHYQNGSYHFGSTNGSQEMNPEATEELNIYMNLILATALPALWMSTSCIYLIFVLWRHRRSSQQLAANVKRPKKGDHHVRIIAMVVSLYLLFLAFLFARIILLLCAISHSSQCSFMMEKLFEFSYLYDAYCYAVLNPMVIVLGVCKLRDALHKLCCKWNTSLLDDDGVIPPASMGGQA